MATQHRAALGRGPAVTFTALIPDLNFFNNRGGTVMPIWRDADTSALNVLPGLVDILSEEYGQEIGGIDLLAYVAGVLGHSGFTETFWDELTVPGVRVPITTDVDLFLKACEIGRKIVWLHTFGERFTTASEGRPQGVQQGVARVLKQIPDIRPTDVGFDPEDEVVRVGDGEIGPVALEVGQYEVSGMRIIDQWLDYRKSNPTGRKTSELDSVMGESWPSDWTSELLEVIWVIEGIVGLEPTQRTLLASILDGPLITEEQLQLANLLPVPESASAAPVVMWSDDEADALPLGNS